MLREYCGAEEAVQHAYPGTQTEAFKPCQRRAENALGAMEAPILVYLSGHCALLPSIAASCQPFKVRDHRHLLVLKSDAVHPGDSFLFPPAQVQEDGRFDQTIMAGHRGGFPNDGEAVTHM
jgi:hypothetical protein